MDLPESVGRNNNLVVQTTQGKVGPKKVETKQIEPEPSNELFFEELKKIKGIGKQTAKDIVNIFKTERQLRIHINNDDELPIRNDVEKLLRGAF